MKHGKFKELLKSKRYNCTTMAQALGVNRQTVSFWIRRKYMPRADEIKRMSELLECTTDEVINSLLSEG